MNKKELMAHAIEASSFGTCKKRQIGAAAYSDDWKLIATASNGRPEPLGRCLDSPCPGAHEKAGSGAPGCYGVHAEEKIFARSQIGSIFALFSTKAPCLGCTLKAIDFGVREIYFITESTETANREVAEQAGLVWEKVDS
jgi:deoxycytidylate deaminase